MITFVVWVLASLALAAIVFLVANVMERRDAGNDESPGVRRFARDFFAGLRRSRRSLAPTRPVETGMDEFFAATVEDAPAYVDAEELSDVWHRARVQARSSLHVGTVHRPQPVDPTSAPTAAPTSAPVGAPVVPSERIDRAS